MLPKACSSFNSVISYFYHVLSISIIRSVSSKLEELPFQLRNQALFSKT